jgi:hypothetical protein
MNNILLDGATFNFSQNNLPLLIHGTEGSGASLLTITIAANLYARGSKIIFLCGYLMAEEEFLKQTNHVPSAGEVSFYTKEHIDEYKQKSASLPDEGDHIVIIKNIELFSKDIFDTVSMHTKVIISGDLNACHFKEMVLSRLYNSKIIFSPLEDIVLPGLKKYEGFFVSENRSEIITMETNS